MKKNGTFFVLTMWWFIICFIIGTLILFFTPDTERISYDENRVLQNAPALSVSSIQSGEFAEKFESFLSDSIPGRRLLIKLSDGILSCISMVNSDDLYYLDTTEKEVNEYFNQTVSASDEASADDGKPVENSDSNSLLNEEEDAYFRVNYKDGNSKILNMYKKSHMKSSAETLDILASLLPEDGKLYFTTMSFPSNVRVFSNNIDIASGWESTLPEKMNELTSDKVVCVDSYEILEPYLKEGEDLFLHTNHQWNDRGAYYIFSSIIESQGLTPTPFDEYSYDVNRVYKGVHYDDYNLLYPLAPSHNWRVFNIDKKEKLHFMNYHVGNTLSYLDGTQFPWKKVETGFHTGRSALVIGDCFTLAFTPFLLPYYDEVHATQLTREYFKRAQLGTSVTDMIHRNHITDIYYISSESSGVNTETLQFHIKKMLD